MNRKYTVAVVGAGAAGLACAIEAMRTADENNTDINLLLIDSMPRVGKKILATGNGRCNLSNSELSADKYFGNTVLVESVFERYNLFNTLSFFSSLGLFTKTDFAGRIYPMSGQASAVLDCLRFACEESGAEIITDTRVERIIRNNDSYIINENIVADRIIIAAGGCAQSVHGSDGSGLSLIKSLGVEINPVFPSLTPITVKNFTKALKGIRADGRITVKKSGKILASEAGEIQYTDYGLSGIPSLEVSRAVSEHFYKNMPGEIVAIVDRAPRLAEDEISRFIRSFIKNRPFLACSELFTGIMPKRLGSTVLSDCAINPEKPLKTLNDGVVDVLVKNIKAKKYVLSGVLGFNEAQVTAGGVADSEINCADMSLRKYKDIYVCGELVDVDGKCGGYNLQWAWSSGRLAGMSAVKSLM